MISNFSFENVLSFKDPQAFSMMASAKKERLFDDSQNYIENTKDSKTLSTAVLYGANASGKSNLIKALLHFKNFMVTGNQNLDNWDLTVPNFQLDAEKIKMPSQFEIECFWKGKCYRYGFSVLHTGIEEEWLYVKEKRESEVFYRKKQRFSIPAKNKILQELTSKKMVHSKAFLLTIGAQFNDASCAGFLDWVYHLTIISGKDDRFCKDFTVRRMKESKAFSQKVIELIKFADFGIEDLSIHSIPSQYLTLSVGTSYAAEVDPHIVDDLQSKRFVMNAKGVPELKEFLFGYFESEGTQKFAHVVGPILDVLEKGSVLVIDELDTKLHPELTERLVLLFHNKEINKHKAQLIFTSHNTHLLDAKICRRDQIYFVEKDAFGASQLYSLANFKKDGKSTRNDENIELNYRKGKYGALPILGDFDNRLHR
jgi:AAA15 family ATPase/GTPase